MNSNLSVVIGYRCIEIQVSIVNIANKSLNVLIFSQYLQKVLKSKCILANIFLRYVFNVCHISEDNSIRLMTMGNWLLLMCNRGQWVNIQSFCSQQQNRGELWKILKERVNDVKNVCQKLSQFLKKILRVPFIFFQLATPRYCKWFLIKYVFFCMY